MKTNDSGLALAEGALFSVLFALLYFLSFYLPVGLGFPLLLLLPVIPALHTLRRGFAQALGFAMLTASLAGFLSEWSFLLLIVFYSTGLGLGSGLRRQTSAQEIEQTQSNSAVAVFLSGYCGAMFGILLLIQLTPLLTGSTLLQSVSEILNQMVLQAEQWAATSQELTGDTVTMLRAIQSEIRLNMIFLLSCMAAAQTFISFQGMRYILKRLKHPLPPLADFMLWRLPSSSMYVLLCTFVSLLFFDEATMHWLYLLFSCINQLVLLLCVFIGIAVADFYLVRWRWPRWLRLLARPALFFIPLLQSASLLVGMLDVGFNLRRLKINKEA